MSVLALFFLFDLLACYALDLKASKQKLCCDHWVLLMKINLHQQYFVKWRIITVNKSFKTMLNRTLASESAAQWLRSRFFSAWAVLFCPSHSTFATLCELRCKNQRSFFFFFLACKLRKVALCCFFHASIAGLAVTLKAVSAALPQLLHWQYVW